MKKIFWSCGEMCGPYFVGLILVLTIAIRFAGPVRDGDFFWHVKYGEYLLENRTLVPDHTIYSWTPADNSTIYCTWVADILLCLLNRDGGLSLLFAFRYLCMLGLVIIVWLYARSMGQALDISTFLILAVVLLASYSAAFLDPDIISALLMALTSGLFFSVRASLWGKWGTRPFLFFPFLFLLWVNIHGVFFSGLILLALLTFGEALNSRFSRGCSLTPQGMRHLLTGAFLSLGASLINPYGYKLHLQILTTHIAGEAGQGIQNLSAYRTIFSRSFCHMHYVDLWLMMIVSFLAFFFFLMWKKRELDWAIILPTLFLSLIFARYARATFYWPAFWAMSIIYMRKRTGPFGQVVPNAGRLIPSALLLLFLFLSGRAIYDSVYRPFLNQWLGFGIGDANPVQASAFIREHQPGKLLYNSYGVGGYLIYDLCPDYRVFIDPRYFPHKKWYGEYYGFNNGPTPLEEFVKKYPFDVAVMDYHFSKNAINKFLLSREWDPVFYGPAAVVFVRKGAGFDYDLHKLDRRRFDDLKTLHQAYTVFIAAQNLGDLKTSDYILELIKKNFSFMSDYERIVSVCTVYQDGLTAMAEEDYEVAFARLNPLGLYPYRLKANNSLVKLRNWKARQFVTKGEYRKGLDLIEATLQAIPHNVVALYNAGIIGYMIEMRENSRMIKKGDKQASPKSLNENPTNWRSHLQRFLELTPDHPNALIAREVLEGKGLPKKVPLIC